jgi:peptidoglycan/LPS O-acetylase OafA/YrhL
LEIAKFIAHNYYNIQPNYDTFVKNNLESFICNIFLLHNILGNPLSYNGPSWAVGAEFFSYVIFAVVVFFFRRSINVLFAVLILLYSKNYSLLNFYSIWGFSTNLNSLYDFAVGGLFGSIFVKQKYFLNFFMIILLLIFIICNKYYLALIPFLFGCILLLSSIKNYSFYFKIIFNRFFFLIGKISYSIYLIHSLVLWITIQFFSIVLKLNVLAFEIFESLLFLVLIYFLTLTISIASFKYVENIFYKKI